MTKPTADAAIAGLFDTHAPALVLYARQWVGAAEAEDVLQRVFVRMLELCLPSNPRSWLFRCVRNEAIATWRSSRRRTRREQSVAARAPAWLVASPDDPLDVLAAQAALETLSDDQREAVTLRLWAGLTLTEIADVTGVAPSTIQRRYEAALDALRQKLEQPCRNRTP